MATTLDQLKAQRDELLRIQGKGLSGYSIKDRSVQFRDPEELRAALADVERRIKALEGSGPLREVRIYAQKGI